MIRYSPIGILLALAFIVFGPHNWFLASDRVQHTQTVSSTLSPVLPDAKTLGDQPRHSMVDIVETKQGYMVRTASGGQLRFELIVGAGLLLLLGWGGVKVLMGDQQSPNETEEDD